MSITVKFKRQLHWSGGSLVIVIPREIIDAHNLKNGDELQLYSQQGKIIIEKVEDKDVTAK